MSKSYKKGPRNGGTPPGGWTQVIETVREVVETVKEAVEAIKSPDPVEEPAATEIAPPQTPVEEKQDVSQAEPETAPVETQPDETKTAEAPATRKKR